MDLQADSMNSTELSRSIDHFAYDILSPMFILISFDFTYISAEHVSTAKAGWPGPLHENRRGVFSRGVCTEIVCWSGSLQYKRRQAAAGSTLVDGAPGLSAAASGPVITLCCHPSGVPEQIAYVHEGAATLLYMKVEFRVIVDGESLSLFESLPWSQTNPGISDKSGLLLLISSTDAHERCAREGTRRYSELVLSVSH